MDTRSTKVFIAGFLAFSFSSANDQKEREIKFPSGSVKEKYSYYLDDKGREVRNGLYEEWYSNGAKKGAINWKDGKEQGPVTYYHPGGRKSYEANYREGKKNGFATVWYENGQKQWQTTFREGLTNGVWREWYPDGKRKFEANYSDGKLDGLATWWHPTGRLWQERVYAAGVAVKGTVKEWDKTGKQTYPPPDAAKSEETEGAAETIPPLNQGTASGGSGS